MVEMSPKYFEAKRKLEAFVNKYPRLREDTVYIGNLWEAALEKDPTGVQCLNWVNDFIEAVTPMEG